ncbi:uncharacterized protein HRG_07566 [Hirsutella rhossiliensis]|uniref:Uncharacterized protein n=1 Tax=Hirsutella rhossiliensis TaxID=111463 RepID=A0A9P8SG11_9HYPO|nr:uncharacterized protein HRG_07566 [Hirsutella rhossiliensis]KAH0961488.1 hypothetical protein HRG_07566 [Hirsutella rhossiliensis]
MTAADAEHVRGALSLIQETNLPHLLGPLLCAFVEEALDPGLAAIYIEHNYDQSRWNHWVFLTHADLNLRNIPALFESLKYNDMARRLIHNVSKAFEDYSKEVEVEKRSWEERDNI